jgi:hypothetical protein
MSYDDFRCALLDAGFQIIAAVRRPGKSSGPNKQSPEKEYPDVAGM